MSNTLQDRLAQAMRDRNSPDAWVSPQLVPFDHFAAVALEEFASWLRSDEASEAVSMRISQLIQDDMCVCGSCLAEELPEALAKAVADTPPSPV